MMQTEPAGTAAERIGRHRRGDYQRGRHSLRRHIRQLFDTALRYRERLSGSEWADRYGVIPKGTGAEHGPVTLYGYQRGLVDAMCDPSIPLVTVLKAARVGYTRCATLAIGYHLHQEVALCAVAQPTIPDAEDFGGSEIAPMLRETPVLSRLQRPGRKGEKPDKATFHQLANGASVRVVGAASDDAFRRYSARFQFADEVDGDGWTPGAKTQGEKLKLFWTRGETFWNRKQVRGSTPLIEETSRIWKLWHQSDQRRYFVPCPQCGEMQYLDWGGPDQVHGLKWQLTEDGKLDDVWYVGTCGCIIEERHKVWMDGQGEWRPTATPRTPGHVGFHLWTGMSLNPNAAWRVIVEEWLEALENPADLVQPFVNLRLGKPYKAVNGKELKAHSLLERLEDYGAIVPAGVRLLTAAADIQSGTVDPRIEVAVWGWGAGLECWLIGHWVLSGDPGQTAVWSELDALLKRSFPRADGRALRIEATVIDSGGHHTAETYQFANERRLDRVWAIKGRSEKNGERGRVWPTKPSNKLGRVWYMIGGNAARDWAYGSLAVEDPGPRFVHFPAAPPVGSRPIDNEYFEQLTRERLSINRKGFTEWIKPRGAHEAGVCFVYAYAALCGLQTISPRFVTAVKSEAAPTAAPQATADSPPTPAPADDQPAPEPISRPPPKPPPRPRAPRKRRVIRSSFMQR
ncbi:terminase gpA endonuclease subunit [Fodinicurvata sp. EGI_FJ10296]|uniref:phage terminase large subunit family protein n=1 Tax=Fodinicurvata sp. EGI_FJ10296 TaxID=3231908 RepID=UPI0034521278